MKKAVVIPAEIYETLSLNNNNNVNAEQEKHFEYAIHSMKRKIINLELQLKDILDSNSMNMNEKRTMYNQIFQQLLTACDEYNTDNNNNSINNLSSPPANIISNSLAKENDDDKKLSMTEITNTLPKSLQKKGENVLRVLDNVDGFFWDKKGQIKVNDKEIQGSHIIDLVSDFINRFPRREPPKGWSIIRNKLANSNFPSSVIYNNPRMEELLQTSRNISSTKKSNVRDDANLNNWIDY